MVIDKGSTYIELVTCYDRYGELLSQIPGLEEYSVTNDENEDNIEKRLTWERIINNYQNQKFLTYSFLEPNEIITNNIEDITFDSVLERSEVMARWNLVHEYLSMLTQQEENQNYRLIPTDRKSVV